MTLTPSYGAFLAMMAIRKTTGLDLSSNTSNMRVRAPVQVSRRNLLASGIFVAIATSGGGSYPVVAAETVGKDENCNEATCLGVWDGLLADCPHSYPRNKFGGAGCVSSQDDTPGVFAEPWDYAESTSLDWQEQMGRLETAITKVTQHRGGEVRFLLKQGRYTRVVFNDAKSGEKSVGEFYFTPNDTTVQFRIGSLEAGTGVPFSQSISNMERSEDLRKELRLLKVPVLRNRKRSFFFVEADGLDTFGPGSTSLGPPAEMKTGELEGRQEEDARLRIEPLQQFPFR